MAGRPTGLPFELSSPPEANALLSMVAETRVGVRMSLASGPSDQLKRSKVEGPPGGVRPRRAGLLSSGIAQEIITERGLEFDTEEIGFDDAALGCR